MKVEPRRLAAPDCEKGSQQYVVEDCDVGVFIYDEPNDAFYSQEAKHLSGSPSWLTQVGVKIYRKGTPKDPDGSDAALIVGVTKGAPPSDPYGSSEYHAYMVIYPSDLPSENTEYWFSMAFDPLDIEGSSAFITVVSNAELKEPPDDAWCWCGDDTCNGFPCLLWWTGSEWATGVGYAGNFYSCTQYTQYDPPTAIIDQPDDGATVTNPVHFKGHGVSNAGGNILYYSWYDGNTPLSTESEFDATLSLGEHTILFAVFCSVAGWSPWTTITITVTEDGVGNAEIISFTINPNPVPQGDSTTVSVTGENTGTTSEQFCIGIWSEQHGDGWSDWFLVDPGDTFSWSRVLSDVQYEQDCAAIIWWWNGEESINVDEEWKIILLTGAPCIGGIWESQSVFHTGPFPPGTNQLLAELCMQNLGSQDGCLIYAKFVEYPGESNEAQLGSIWQRVINAGEVKYIDFYWDIPTGETEWPLGVKVWAPDDENEPSWGSMQTKIFKTR